MIHQVHFCEINTISRVTDKWKNVLVVIDSPYLKNSKCCPIVENPLELNFEDWKCFTQRIRAKYSHQIWFIYNIWFQELKYMRKIYLITWSIKNTIKNNVLSTNAVYIVGWWYSNEDIRSTRNKKQLEFNVAIWFNYRTCLRLV